jgi:uncharacterized repeat protein (TIGR01451 family)
LARAAALFGSIGAIAATSIVVGVSQPASAAFGGTTQFEIDGNTAVDGGQDWASDPASATNLNDDPFATNDGCRVSVNPPADDDRIVQGTKINDMAIDNPPVNAGNVPGKTDLCLTYRTWELVFVPTADPNDDPAAGHYEFVFYGAWSRPNVNGEIDVLFPLLGSDTTTNADDLLISYDFVDSTNETFVEILTWSGTEWTATALPAGSFEAVTTRGVETLSNGEELTFGEFAINLTAAGILPANGPCVTFSAGDPISRTGNSANATLEDIVGGTPIELTNCGSLTITKETVPATPAGSPSFQVVTSQLDAEITELTDDLVVPDAPSVTHVDMLIAPDYHVAETALPAGWSQTALVCTSYDPIAGTDVTRTLYSDGGDGPDTAFPVAPGREAVCLVSNIGPPTLTVEKTTVGGIGGPFGFEVANGGGVTALSATTSAADTPTLVDEGLLVLAPGAVSVVESSVAAGFYAGDLTCTLTAADGGTSQLTGSAVEGVPTGVDTEVAAGDTLACVQSNLAAGSVSIEKAVDPPDASGWSFDFTIDPVPTGETATKTATAAAPIVGWGNLRPGVDYTLAEGTFDGFLNGDFVCSNGTAGPVITPAAGEAVTCTADNIELASVSVTKSVDGTAADWAFDFTIDPVPTGETATKTATAANATVGWNGLVPGADYTITEADADGYITGTLSCGGTDTQGTSTFAPEPGASVECTITNTELASVSVTKTVEPAGVDWSVDFTISPVPSGEPASRTATAQAPTVTWDDLVPGTAYTVTEVVGSDLVVGTMACAGGENGQGTSTFTPAPGGDVACSITNTRITDIEVVKTTETTSALPGGPVTWTIRVTNNGPSTALDVELRDEIPALLTLVSVDAPDSWDCSTTVTGNPGVVACSKPDMIPGETWAFTVNTTIADDAEGGASITNVATVSTSSEETSVTNNTDDDAIEVETVVILPPTGGYLASRIAIGSLLVGLGALLLLAQRRREPVG